MSINIIVGGGIFAGPQSMTAVAGSLSFSAWLLAAILVFPIVWGVAKAPACFPGTGGFYNYCRTGISPTWGFVAHWMFLSGYTLGTASAMTLLVRQGLVNRLGFGFAAEHPWATNALILIIFSLLNLMPVGLVSRIQAGATLLKLAPLLIVTGLTFYYFDTTLAYNWEHVDALPLTIPTVIFGYLGFEACCSLSHLLKDGPGSVGKVVLTAFFITAILYMVFHFGLLQIMGPDQLAAEGAMAFPNYLGWSVGSATAFGVAIGAAILLSYSNSLFGVSLGNITNIVSMTQGSTIKAALIHGLVVWSLLCFMSDLRNIFAFTVFGVGVAYFLTVVAVFLSSLKSRNLVQAGIMVLGFVSCAVLFYCCWVDLGGSIVDRALNLSPMLASLVVGFGLYRQGWLKF